MAKYDPEIASHRAWLGLLQPVGLVVSPPALVKAQAVLDKSMVERQQELLSVVRKPPRTAFSDDVDPYLDNFPRFAEEVLGWDDEVLAGTPDGLELDERLELILPDYGETIRPDYAVVDPFADDKALILVRVLPTGTPLDDPPREQSKSAAWHASPQARLERLLRETEVPAAVLCNGHELRLVYAPRGESSGHLTFPVPAMCEVSGRPVLSAMILLLHRQRVIDALDGRRLLDILLESRKYQSEVSNALSEQVLGALWDLLRGFQAADEAANHTLIDRIAREDPQHVYGGLLTVLLRLVFLLYAEDEGLMPADGVYARNYSVTGLYDRLRADAGRYPDTMDQRYGAWAWMVSLFRLVYDGGGHGELRLPTRHGQLFNPDEYPFLEGRRQGVARQVGEHLEAPRVSDGCIYHVLEALLVLDGERLSYRALDVEQIGSVYEAMMGFAVERAYGRSIAVKPKHVVFDVDQLLGIESGKRKKWLKDRADCDVTGKTLKALKEAETPADVIAALGKKVSPRTQRLLAPGALYLQPGEDRRRSGSHYTPRELTEPIVRTTLRPVLEAFGEHPTPEQILDLKICDPAMGSGAFLVEVCRQLAERLVQAWEVHDRLPDLAPDEEPLLHARRLVAQRCLYGVDKNPFAVNLAKLSLWLVTLARDHAFTFLDHLLKHGDSLVGLTRAQIGAFHWKEVKPGNEDLPLLQHLSESVDRAASHRRELQHLGEAQYIEKKDVWDTAEIALRDVRLVGDLIIAAFFGANKDKVREELLLDYRGMVRAWRAGEKETTELQGLVDELHGGERPVPPLHWEIEFAEVFGRENAGFDAFVGNPPFAGKNTIAAALGATYRDALLDQYEGTNGKSDLVAYFFRRAFQLLRRQGTLGLLATNTIAQGDTRSAGLAWICENAGRIFFANSRYRWPGLAVVVCIVAIAKERRAIPCTLDGKSVERITAFLFHGGGNRDPARLAANAQVAFQGSNIAGQGFLFADQIKGAHPVAEMQRIVNANPQALNVIRPMIVGAEVNSLPQFRFPMRHVIAFGRRELAECRIAWPGLIELLEASVKVDRESRPENKQSEYLAARWWQWHTTRPTLQRAKEGLTRVLVGSQVSKWLCLVWLPADWVFSHKLNVFADDSDSFFTVLQSRCHEVWSRFFSSTSMELLSYSPSDCFENFPFPENWQTNPILEAAGKTYYDFRADLMVRNDEGLTKTYNRFHDPDECDPDIRNLRELHTTVDRAVLDAYGWQDIPAGCEFLLDYEIDEETWGRKKKPYRYRWPDKVHDEVLAHLLDLNQKRYREEVAACLHDGKGGKKRAAKSKKKKQAPTCQGTLFD